MHDTRRVYKLKKIFDILKGCSNITLDMLNQKIILSTCGDNDIDISDILLMIYDYDLELMYGKDSKKNIHYSEWIDEKGNRHLPDRYKVGVAAYALEDTIVHLTHSGAKDIVVTKEDDGLIVTFKR